MSFPWSRRLAALLSLLPLAACTPEPVRWEELRAANADASAAALAPGVLGAAEQALLATHAGACPASVRIAAAGGAERHAVWWSMRTDSSAALLAARSDDGGRTWGAAVPVDTLDQGVRGCDRAAPDIVADSASGYVHVVYGLWAPEGPGIFFSHSMERGALYHAPVPIIYGERPARARIAAAGDLVAVAFEDPNSRDPKVGLALSRTMGHIFEHRLPASPKGLGALDPRVAVSPDGALTVSWEQRTGPAGMSGSGVRVERRGVVLPPSSS